jgi:8-oxo-dGTP pyrophosphatase MutT (NUDIX family)
MPADNVELSDGDLRLEPTSGSDHVRGWAIVVDDERIGTAALLHASRSIGVVRWNLRENGDAPNLGRAIHALGVVTNHAFSDLGYQRLETRIPVDDLADIRAASICGFRREGIVRGPGDEPDQALLARLADDPPANSKEGFIALLNAGLPTKRIIAQGLLRDESGRVLLCRLTYKTEWDLPGGVVEVGEAPAAGLVRELEEELGVTVAVRGLITVNWLPAWRGWDDACVLLFDLGVTESSITERMQLQPTEIAGVEWCDEATVEKRATAATRELLAAVNSGAIRPYRESSASSADPED